MKMVKLASIGAVALGFVLAMTMGAQAAEHSKSQEQMTQSERQQYQGRQMQHAEGQFTPELQRASELHGMSVTTYKGEDIGTLEHLAVDTQRGQVVYGIISMGGILDIGDKDTAIPFRLLKGSADSNRLIALVTKDKFKNSPNITDQRINNLGERSWAQKIHQHYGVEPYWQTTRVEASRCPWPLYQGEQARQQGQWQQGQQERMQQQQKMQQQQREQRQMQARTQEPDYGRSGEVIVHDEIIGSSVKSQQGEKVGELSDLMVDLQSGQIGYAVLAYGGLLGMGEELTAVPFNELNFKSRGADQRPEVIAQVSKDELRKAPTFSEGEWPNMSSWAWNQEINEYYDSDPYYVIYGFVLEGEQTRGAQQAQFRDAQRVQLRGTIQRINQNAQVRGERCTQIELKVEKDMSDYRTGRAGQQQQWQQEQQTEQQTAQQQQQGQQQQWKQGQQQKLEGQTVTVNLAPQSYLQDHQCNLSQNDQVTIHGFRQSEQGEPVIFARTIKKGDQSVQLRSMSGQPMWTSQQQQQKQQTEQQGQWEQLESEQEGEMEQ